MTSLTSPGFRSVGFRDMGSPAGALQPVAGAIAWYRCDEGSGQILYDYSGNGNHGVLGSTAGVDTNDPQRNAQGLVFWGDDYATFPKVPSTFTAIFVHDNNYSTATDMLTSPIVFNGATPGDYLAGLGIDRLSKTHYHIGVMGRGRSTDYLTVQGNCAIALTYSDGVSSLIECSNQNNKITLAMVPNISGSVSSIGKRSTSFMTFSGYSLSIYPFIFSPPQIAQQYAYEKARLATKQVILP